MFAKVFVIFAAFAASSASLINTGSSVSSRVMDGHGNYAFEYGIASAGAKRSRSEVGSGYAGPIKTSYSVADSHIAPVGPVVAHAAPALLAAPAYAPAYAAAPLGLGLGHAGVVGYGAGFAGAHGLGYGAPALGYGLGYGHGVVGAPGLGYGHGLAYGPALGLGRVGLHGAGRYL